MLLAVVCFSSCSMLVYDPMFWRIQTIGAKSCHATLYLLTVCFKDLLRPLQSFDQSSATKVFTVYCAVTLRRHFDMDWDWDMTLQSMRPFIDIRGCTSGESLTQNMHCCKFFAALSVFAAVDIFCTCDDNINR